MTTSPTLPQNFITDTWVKATWEEFMALAYNPTYETAKAYYNRGKARIEMTPIGWNHAEDNSIISTLVILFCALRRIPVKELTNCSFRKMAASSVGDDLGEKRLLYERLAVQEYWVVDVNRAEVTAFAVAEGGSRQIDTSQVLPGLTMALVRETLERSRAEEHGAVTRWLLSQFS
jgi:Uma2 family endonuclease